MKKRTTMLIMSMTLAVLLIAGGTFAWFTATADPIENNFKAGTLIMTVEENFIEDDAQNINPGDCIPKTVIFCNEGSKRMFVRVELDAYFEEQLETEGIVNYEIGEGWVLDGEYYYYTAEVMPENCTPPLITQVCFDGPAMNNDYQGAEFTLTVNAEAIQVTNGAAEAVWGINPKNLGVIN